jgi:hypothetical protein
MDKKVYHFVIHFSTRLLIYFESKHWARIQGPTERLDASSQLVTLEDYKYKEISNGNFRMYVY